MKKTILSTLMIAMFGFSTVALAQNVQNPVVQEQQQEKKTEIKLEQLPDAVKAGWEKSTYKDENVEKVFKVESQTNEFIEFIVMRDSDKYAVHFDMTGKFLREKKIDAQK